jgi:hypothetical protein
MRYYVHYNNDYDDFFLVKENEKKEYEKNYNTHEFDFVGSYKECLEYINNN